MRFKKDDPRTKATRFTKERRPPRGTKGPPPWMAIGPELERKAMMEAVAERVIRYKVGKRTVTETIMCTKLQYAFWVLDQAMQGNTLITKRMIEAAERTIRWFWSRPATNVDVQHAIQQNNFNTIHVTPQMIEKASMLGYAVMDLTPPKVTTLPAAS